MSLHGGFLGVIVSLILFARRHRLQLLRVCDYVACATPFDLVLVRIANFVNGELWGRPSSLPWAVIFPSTQDGIPRHPSQLYEAALDAGLDHLWCGLTMGQTLSMPMIGAGIWFYTRSLRGSRVATVPAA